MKLTTIDEKTKRRAACEAYYLLNWAIGDLVVMNRLFEMTKQWETDNPAGTKAIAGTRRFLTIGLIVVVYRLDEAREQMISGWLLSQEELEGLGFPPMVVYIGGKQNWSYFATIRGYAGHSVANNKSSKKRPGRIIPAKVFGKALRETGLIDPEAFFKRITAELIPGVENVRDKLRDRYPETEQFIKDYASDYASELEASGV